MAIIKTTGTATDFDDFLGDLYTALTGTPGWTGNQASGTGGDPASSQRSVESPDGLHVHLIPDEGNDEIRFQPSTGYTGGGATDYRDHPGSPKGSAGDDDLARCRMYAGAVLAWSGNYWIYANDSGRRYCHAVLETEAGVFAHLAFGAPDRYYTDADALTGAYATALGWNDTDNSLSTIPFMHHRQTGGAGGESGGQWVRLSATARTFTEDVAGISGVASRWACRIGFNVRAQGNATYGPQLIHGVNEEDWEGLLLPIWLKVQEDSASDSPIDHIILGEVQDLRLVNLAHKLGVSWPQTVAIDTETWDLFPLRAWGDGGYAIGSGLTNWHGLAYRAA